jgi:hypothetical protein
MHHPTDTAYYSQDGYVHPSENATNHEGNKNTLRIIVQGGLIDAQTRNPTQGRPKDDLEPVDGGGLAAVEDLEDYQAPKQKKEDCDEQ